MEVPMNVSVLALRIKQDSRQLLVRMDGDGHVIGAQSKPQEGPLDTVLRICGTARLDVSHVEIVELTGTPATGHSALFLALARSNDAVPGQWGRFTSQCTCWTDPYRERWHRLAMYRLSDLVANRHGIFHLMSAEWTTYDYLDCMETILHIQLDRANVQKIIKRYEDAGVVQRTGNFRSSSRSRPSPLFRCAKSFEDCRVDVRLGLRRRLKSMQGPRHGV